MESPFTWGAGGAQMTPESIAAQRKIAEALLAQGMDTSPVKHWTQGAARVAQTLLGSYDNYAANKAESANRDADQKTIAGLLMPQAPATAAAAPPAAAPPAAAPPDGAAPTGLAPPAQIKGTPIAPPPSSDFMPNVASLPTSGGSTGANAALPRGIRNNNPLNIEAGDFTRGQPGFSGSDGRFAKFDTPEGGIGAANKLLDIYQNKHGLNTVAGIIGRWAPTSDGNNVSAYAANVAQQLGIGPNDPIPPEMRPKLIAAMGQHENGRPIQVASLGGGMPGSVQPSAPPPAAALPAPMAAPAAAPPTAQPSAPSGGMPGVDPRLIQAITSPYAGEGVKKVAALLLQQQMGDKVSYQTTPDGDILAMDPHGRAPPKVVYQATPKPISVAENAQLWDPRTRTFITPNQQGATAPDAKPLPLPPPGADPKTWKTEQTKIAADASAGKLTEVQANSTAFANRMEDAERNLATIEPEISQGGWGVLKDRVARGVTGGQYNPIPQGATNWAVSDKFQKYEQAKSQFITAILRRESGAAISPAEFDRYDKEFFPQVGQGPEVVKQKQDARRVALEAMKKGAGPGYTSAAVPTSNSGPSVDDLVKKYSK